MPKQKTRKCVAKRVKQTGTGKFVRKQAGVRHLSTGKTRNRKRLLTQDRAIDSANLGTVTNSLPYGLK